jgi:hypothetical protein
MTQTFPSKIHWKNAKGDLSIEPSLLSDKELMCELLHYLNRKEESDAGTVFRPNTISSCRVMDGSIIGKVLKEMEKRV